MSGRAATTSTSGSGRSGGSVAYPPSELTMYCRDGSISPPCSCAGPHRGCCSHHGGIAACR